MGLKNYLKSKGDALLLQEIDVLKENMALEKSQVSKLKEAHKKKTDQYEKNIWGLIHKQELERVTKNCEMRDKSLVYENLAHSMLNSFALISSWLNKSLQKDGLNKEISRTLDRLAKLKTDICSSLHERHIDFDVSLLDHSKIINLSELLKNVCGLYKDYSKAKKVTMAVNLCGKVLVKADPDALEIVIDALIGNAIKHSNEGDMINIDLELKEGKVLFSVSDQAIHITDEQEKDIPDKDHQSRIQQYGDYGTGLYYSLLIIESLEGEFDLKRNEGKGGRFTVTLPEYNRADEEKITPHTPEKALKHNAPGTIKDFESKTNQCSILWVDDNAEVLSELKEKLKDKYNLYYTKSGSEALEKLKKMTKMPDFIISEMVLPDMDGIAFKEKINESKDFSGILLIYLTTEIKYSEKYRAADAGAMDILIKPVQPGILIETLQNIHDYVAEKKDRELLSPEDKMIFISEPYDKNHPLILFEKKCNEYQLTPHQKEIARLLYSDLTRQEVAEKLSVELTTVDGHIQNIYKKTDTNNRSSLITRMFSNENND